LRQAIENVTAGQAETKSAARTVDSAGPLPLVEGEDYYLEGPAMVFTAAFLRRRGYCCDSGCRHCPYSEKGAEQRAR